MTDTAVHHEAADRAYRRAWWALVLYPVSFVAAFVVGEGLAAALTGSDTGEDPAFWQVLVAGSAALLVFVVPGVLSVVEGRRAMRLGRPDGRLPALIGAVVGLGFIALNVGSYALGLVVDR